MTKRSKVLFASLFIILILLAVLLIYLFIEVKGTDSTLPDKINFTEDANSEVGDLSGKSEDDIVAALNQKVQEGSINISMNTNPTFTDGKAKGTLMITNSTANRYPQLIEIYTKDTKQLLYRGGVGVGHKIESSTLLVDLAKGTYDCIAYFNAIDTKTNICIGTAAANIKITILA